MSAAALAVLACGGAASLQDGGRRGHQRYGLSASGLMDRPAHAAANALVGNAPDAAAIEFGLGGGSFRAEGGAVRLALAGAPCALSIDGDAVGDHRSFVLREGAVLVIRPPRSGVFAYLAAGGGLDAPRAMGSVSLHQRAALGGIAGRGLRAGDRLPVAGPPREGEPDRLLEPVPLDEGAPIRVVLGPQDDHFTAEGLATLTRATFTVSARADRMGYQLDGPGIAHGVQGYNIVSDATVAGSIQVPGSGCPIVLLADRQTTGGYPKIATVVSADLRRIAQRRPNAPVRFETVPVDAAVRLARARAAWLAELPTRLKTATGAAERLLTANVAGNAVDALGGEDDAD